MFAAERCSELLDKMAEAFKKAHRHPGPGAIHDVRVSIRRLRQCLDVFESQFPGQAAEKIDKRVHKVLKAAGELRHRKIPVSSTLPSLGAHERGCNAYAVPLWRRS